MSDFGIEGYRPRWVGGREAVVREHGARLGSLAGRTLTGVWLVWDARDDQWFCDCPVLFDFAGEQVEVNHNKLDELSLTWNSVDPRRPVDWFDFDLRWRAEPLAGLRALLGRRLTRVDLYEWLVQDVPSGTVDITFVFEETRVRVYNALDENGLDIGPPAG
ncbi:hypothetical protein [Actinacidiphila glaucinigra]|uniref:Uncharacterized protein n=1 Tax=Actinacidiphila glaucinigra TaxID=235986 RepID=A0A239MWJ1_9ACTN|nr:hypothetical protein [Actinacidiphila glaucinigra]SNT47086.1 hypothetical protein SAMN05216252_12896 [Actinacidiphila glaucinigra]